MAAAGSGALGCAVFPALDDVKGLPASALRADADAPVNVNEAGTNAQEIAAERGINPMAGPKTAGAGTICALGSDGFGSESSSQGCMGSWSETVFIISSCLLAASRARDQSISRSGVAASIAFSPILLPAAPAAEADERVLLQFRPILLRYVKHIRCISSGEHAPQMSGCVLDRCRAGFAGLGSRGAGSYAERAVRGDDECW